MPSITATSAWPCDSPAVRKRSISAAFYTKFLPPRPGPRDGDRAWTSDAFVARRTRCLSAVCAHGATAPRTPSPKTSSRFLHSKPMACRAHPFAAGYALCRARRRHVAGPGNRRARVDRAPSARRGGARGVAGDGGATVAAVASRARALRGLRLCGRERVVRGVRAAAARRPADPLSAQAASLPAFLRAHGVVCGLQALEPRRRSRGLIPTLPRGRGPGFTKQAGSRVRACGWCPGRSRRTC